MDNRIVQISSRKEIVNVKRQFTYSIELNEFERNKIKNYFRTRTATFEKIVQEKLKKNSQLYKITKNKNKIGTSKDIINACMTQPVNTIPTVSTYNDPYVEVKITYIILMN